MTAVHCASLSRAGVVKQTAPCSAIAVPPQHVRHTVNKRIRFDLQHTQLGASTGLDYGRPWQSLHARLRMATTAAAGSATLVRNEALDFAMAMAKVADDTKATDLSVLHVEPLVSWTSYMVICTVMSRPQLLAVLSRMEDTAKDDWKRTKQNSAGSSQWEVIDFGDVVVHVFTAEQREHYDLDGFYAAAEEVPLPFVDDQISVIRSENELNNRDRKAVASSVWSKNLMSI